MHTVRSSHAPRRASRRAAGFTLIELMITLVVFTMVVGALFAVMFTAQRSKSSTSNAIETTQSARTAMMMIARDLRSAGYDVDNTYPGTPQPPIAYIDSMQVLINENLQPWPDTLSAAHQAPLAYNPNGNPRPYPLVGSSWTPPARYRTGAELVRYTLDVNNDGAVNANDVAAPDGADAARTPNPDDYVLVRQVYGDSTGNITGNNGGTTEHIALVARPGGANPPMFRVYMQGSSTPWDWSNGPVPAAQLERIERVEVNVTATSPKPDWTHQYARTVFSSTVNSMRNTPSFGLPTYIVNGWVFNDLNHDLVRQPLTDPGIPGALVRCGNLYTCYTNATGYFQFEVPAGTYTLRHTPATGYGVEAPPDTFVITVPGPQQRSFADVAIPGGWAHVLAFEDLNNNGTQEAGEPGLAAVQVTVNGVSSFTDRAGEDSVFVAPGAYTVTVTPPDSFVVSGTNPQTGTMLDGGSTSHTFALVQNSTGKVQGEVFRDNNRNGILDGTEVGVQGVWVGVTDDGGTTIQGYTYTDANGLYSITVPINDPPHTKPYTVFYIPPAGSYPTASVMIGGLWVQSNAVLTGNNFGVATYQVITLNASRVLSLACGDLIENDWNGNHVENADKDVDLALGADAGATNNLSVWFNQYDNTPLFTPNPTYARTVPQSVLSIALDTLDMAPPIARPDVVTGTKASSFGNFFVWLNQNSNNNEGYLPGTFSPGLNYRTQDNGDVSSVLTLDCAGGNMPDLIVGTRSPTAGNGTFEIWQNSNAISPTFSRQEIYPPAGNLPGNRLGEVTCMALADLNADGLKDLVVGTKTGTYSGEIKVLRYSTKNNGDRFLHAGTYSTPGEAITAICVLDMDGDGLRDIVAGVQDGVGSGHLQYWHNDGMSGSGINFSLRQTINAPGIVVSLCAVDFGSLPKKDIAMGWRQNETSYVGGLLIYYTDLGVLPFSGVDPSSGSIVNMVPALTSGNFNYGTQPVIPPPPYLPDIAAGVKISQTTGALVVFIR